MKYAVRVLAREKGFSSLAIATLALGVGAVTTILSVVNGALRANIAETTPLALITEQGENRLKHSHHENTCRWCCCTTPSASSSANMWDQAAASQGDHRRLQ